MALTVPTGILPLLVALTLGCSSLAADTCTTALSCLAALDRHESTGASFVQRQAMRHTAGVVSQRKVDTLSDSPSARVNRTMERLWSPLEQIATRREAEDGSAVSWLVPASIFTVVALGTYLYFASNREVSEGIPVHKLTIPEQGSAPGLQVTPDSERRSPRDVVEDLGFGFAQLRMLLLADGVWFIDGWELTLVALVATSTASDLDLKEYGRASLSSMAMLGLMPGAIIGGYLGDHMGRKPPIIISYAAMIACAWGTAMAPNFKWLLVLRFLMGVSSGIGMPSSTVMLSELSPLRWRGAMIAGRGFMFQTGAFLAHAFCLAMDPTLTQLDWRHCFMMTIPPSLIFMIFTWMYLFESPLFLACIGDHANAQLSFAKMRELNSCPEISISYADSSSSEGMDTDRTPTGSFRDHLYVIFSFGMIGCSLTLIVSNMFGQLYNSGHNYGLPRVLVEESSKLKLAAGTQMMLDCLWGYVGCLLVIGLDIFLSRKRLLMLFQVLLASAFVLVAWSVHSPSRTLLAVVVMQLSLGTVRMLLKVNILSIQLSATECYPTALNATALALCTGFSRVGSTLAPMMFEWFTVTTGLVTAFYYACSTFCVFNFLFIFGLLPKDMETARLCSSEVLSSILVGDSGRRSWAAHM
mmetsp:Transcript_63319/g.119934  ORF Transcript_63319/g.119934 Transcript_63319/m.119934 type:complete len:640 (+) Transcript_63319:57-1976(+)